ncbi:MAG: flagellar protein FliS [Defluviitaleaceae bacterium]|nr:flagellar protein FliS [Defluviitaleaceae bacterium]
MNTSDYVARIGNANPAGLVAITYELIMAHVGDAIRNHNDDREYVRHVETSIELLGTLIDALNMDYELSRTLFPLYIYVNKLLINAKLTRRTRPLEDVRKILAPLHSGWRELAESEPGAEPAIDASQTIFAGLTYGRGELNEYIQEDGNKSYKA